MTTMTPTEQDKELEKAVWASLASQITHAINCTDTEHKRQDSCVDFTEKNFEQLMQLITSYTKQRELKARIDELNNVRDMDLSLVSHHRVIDRIAKLKAQQEEV